MSEINSNKGPSLAHRAMAEGLTPEIINYSSWQLIKDIWEMLQPYKRRFWLASFVRMLGDLAWLYPAFALSYIVTFLTKYQSGQSLKPIFVIIILWFVAALIRVLGQYFGKYIGFKVANSIATDLNLKAIKHLFKLDMVWHEKENSGNKIKRIQNAREGLYKIVWTWFNNIIEVIVNFIAMNFIIAQFDKTVFFTLILFSIIYFFIAHLMSKKASNAHKQVNEKEENVGGLFFELINNIRSVKVMAMAHTLYSMFTEKNRELLDKLNTRIFLYQRRSSTLIFCGNIFRIIICIIIIRGILNGYYEIGFLVLFYGYFNSLWSSIDELSNASMEFTTSKLSIARLKEILDEPIKIEDENGKENLSKDWKKIIVKNLYFAYADEKSKNKSRLNATNILNNISFEINRGEKIGIVGVSGAGKSTLLKLLLKEREEFDGDILFDDGSIKTSIKQIKKNDYFKQVSVVLQDTEVFNFSLRDNIVITNNEQKDNQKLLDKALKVSHMIEVVKKLPQGLDTLIGEKGVKLSGGERQRLGLARAIFKEPEILLLDEATSHLDLESEEKIRDSLHKFFKDITAIVIAHRLTTIKEMDKILVIENGKIVESGNFEELISKQGRFHELWEKQRF